MDYHLRGFGDMLLLLDSCDDILFDESMDFLNMSTNKNQSSINKSEDLGIENNISLIDKIQGVEQSKVPLQLKENDSYYSNGNELAQFHITPEFNEVNNVIVDTRKYYEDEQPSIKQEEVEEKTYLLVPPTSSISIIQDLNTKNSIDLSRCSEIKNTGYMYQYSRDDSNRYFKFGKMKILRNAFKNPKKISKDVNRTVDDELEVYSKYSNRPIINKSKRSLMTRDNEERLNRKSGSLKEVVWKPLSVFTVYTSIKNSFLEKTDYFDNIPSSSCFGKLNMRVKGAWSRSANKDKIRCKREV